MVRFHSSLWYLKWQDSSTFQEYETYHMAPIDDQCDHYDYLPLAFGATLAFHFNTHTGGWHVGSGDELSDAVYESHKVRPYTYNLRDWISDVCSDIEVVWQEVDIDFPRHTMWVMDHVVGHNIRNPLLGGTFFNDVPGWAHKGFTNPSWFGTLSSLFLDVIRDPFWLWRVIRDYERSFDLCEPDHVRETPWSIAGLSSYIDGPLCRELAASYFSLPYSGGIPDTSFVDKNTAYYLCPLLDEFVRVRHFM